MDKNRLIQIANHFDKIGAYTISDEFENKFIRTAAPIDRMRRNPEVAKTLGTGTYGQKFYDAISSGLTEFLKQFPSTDIFLNNRRESYKLIPTWHAILGKLKEYPRFKSDSYIMSCLVRSRTLLRAANTEFEKNIPLNSVSNNDPIQELITLYGDTLAGDTIELISGFASFVDREDIKYGSRKEFDNYINNLRQVEVELLNIRNKVLGQTPIPNPPPSVTPATPPATPPAAPPAATPAAAGGGGARPSAPSSGSGSASAAGGKPQGASGSSAGGSKTQSKPSGSSAKKLSLSEINNELSKIVFRKIKSYYKNYDDKKLYLDMKEDNQLKAYLLINKDSGLRGSIRDAIKAKYDGENETALLEKLNSKIAKSIDYTKPKPVETQNVPKPSEQGAAAGAGTTAILTPDERVKQEARKLNTFNFECSRQGLDYELKRMDKLFDEDPDKFMSNFLSDIERFINCHLVLRNSLLDKDNLYFDTFVNDLERKYFAYTFRKDLPY